MLTREHARFFARNGFLQLSGLVDPAVCAHLVEHTWGLLPPDWRRDDPSSWRGQVRDSCHVANVDYRNGLLKFQDKRLRSDPHVIRAFQATSPPFAVVSALIGRPMKGIHLRGLYTITPLEDPESAPSVPAPHVEAHPVQVIALAYLEDVAPGGGGLLVWPGSHRELYPAFGSSYDFVTTPALQAAMDACLRWRPVELAGRRGDVVLCHHRLLHSPSINRSSRIRFGFLCDYNPQDLNELCRRPPGALWQDWPGLAALAGADGLDGEPDFAREPAVVERRRLRKAAVGTLSSRNKAEASDIVRCRVPGEVWLSLSDSRELYHSHFRLDPRGGPLTSVSMLPWRRGVRVWLNGEPVRSLSATDITTPLRVRPGRNRLVVSGVTKPLYLRVLAIEAPFTESRVLVRRECEAGTRRLSLDFTWQPAAAVAAAT